MTKIAGHIVDIVNYKIFTGIILIENGIIQKIVASDDVPNQFIIPGFVDAHIHIESSPHCRTIISCGR